jgi:hypothetical protein
MTNKNAENYIEEYEFTQVEVQGLPQSYILESNSIDRLLLVPGRRLFGWERQQAAFLATVSWFRALQSQNLLPTNLNDLCTLTVLAEGAGHNLPSAISAALGNNVHRGDNWIGVSRFPLPRKESDSYTDFDARVTYIRLHTTAPVWCVLDTLATGATLVRGLEAAFANATKPQKILFATPAGSAVGARKIAELCEREGVELNLTFFGAVLGLWQDGTALPWCHPDTVLSGTPRSKYNSQLAKRLFNNLEGFCAVGDCSANFFDVAEAKKILAEEEEKFGWHIPEPKPLDLFIR